MPICVSSCPTPGENYKHSVSRELDYFMCLSCGSIGRNIATCYLRKNVTPCILLGMGCHVPLVTSTCPKLKMADS